MDLLIASVNKDKEDYRWLSNVLPLVTYNNHQQDKEYDFYRILLDSYSKEEKYLIFYYTWFQAMIQNVFYADFILNINLLSKNFSYRENVIEFLEKRGIHGIDFEDAKVKEYSSYPLPGRSMGEIDDIVREAIITSFNEDQINYLFQKIPIEFR